MKIETFNDVIRYLNGTYSLTDRIELKTENRESRLMREQALLRMFGHPESSMDIIHIAGSKGKGTTAAYLSGLLCDRNNEEAKIGIFSSPHVFSYKERWCYTSPTSYGIAKFQDSDYIRAAATIEEKLGDYKTTTILEGGVPPTPFEMYTLFAFVLFAQMNIKLAIIETGIGGRLDCTNVVHPLVSVITHIEKEHTDILGKTLEDIAKEKCGIIKEGVPVFTVKQSEEVLNVIRREAEKRNAPLYIAEPSPKIDKLFKNSTMQSSGAKEDLTLAYNVALSLRGAENRLGKINAIKLPGRAEAEMNNRTLYVLDGAHTKDSIEDVCKNYSAIIATLARTTSKKVSIAVSKDDKLEMLTMAKACTPKSPKVAVFGASENKDIEGMLSVLIQHFKTIYLTNTNNPNHPSNLTKTVLALEKVMKNTPSYVTKEVYVFDTLEECIDRITRVRMDRYVYAAILGSFYLVGEFFDSNKWDLMW